MAVRLKALCHFCKEQVTGKRSKADCHDSLPNQSLDAAPTPDGKGSRSDCEGSIFVPADRNPPAIPAVVG